MYFAVQVQSRKEDYLITLIKERVDPLIFDDVFTPKRITGRKVNGVWEDKLEIMFPGYIFVSTTRAKDFSVALIRMPDFARMLGREKDVGDFIPLSEDECIVLDTLCGKDVDHLIKKSLITVTEGKKVTVVSGPLFGLKGKVTKVDLHKMVAYVDIVMLGRLNNIKVGIEVLRPFNEI